MLIITGAAGFIGSCLVRKLNDAGFSDIVVVDEFSRKDKNRNLEGKDYHYKIDRDEFISWLQKEHPHVEAVFHMGARTDTTEKSTEVFDRLNLNYSKAVWQICTRENIPLIYASSAATYGLGEHGYEDDHTIVHRLHPLNPYGQSKNDFDIWALQQEETPPFWVGMKFFNVYGPNEYHKGRMASVIFHTVNQIHATGGMKLFRSHRPDFADGRQSRDFVYVKDVVDVLLWMWEHQPESGLYNLGTGVARSFLDLAESTFRTLYLEPNISYIDTPEDIRDTYQYFTEADMSKLRRAGYDRPFHSLELGVEDYVKNYLEGERIW
jgi:ADP-L-glycero-D-manno-heptose 6-epimerase